MDNLKVDATGGVNVGSPLGHLADKTDGGEDDFADMPPLEDASDHDRSSPKQGLSTPTLDSLVVIQAKDLESHSTTLIDDHHVEAVRNCFIYRGLCSCDCTISVAYYLSSEG